MTDHLTVGELIEFLSNLPEDFRVFATINEINQMNGDSKWVDLPVNEDDIQIDYEKNCIRF